MRRHRRHLRHALAAAGVLSVLAAALLAPGSPARGDDTELFREQAGKPYLFIILDTSTSMNTDRQDKWVPASADDRRSKLYEVKRALLQVFDEVYSEVGDIVHFGFASFNQDHLRIRGKHWLYRVDAIDTPLPIGYPTVGSLQTLGKHFALGAGTTDGVAGSCTAPLSFATPADVLKLDRFAKLEPLDANGDGRADGYKPTTLWLKQGAEVYRLDVEHVAGSGNFGNLLKATFTLRKKNPSDICPNASNPATATVTMSYVTEFLMSDEEGGNSAQVAHCTSASDKDELTAGVGWTWQDAFATDTCGGQKPHSGRGWESNYDSPPLLPGQTDDDPFNGYSVKHPTTQAGAGERPIDTGDMLPYHWALTNRVAFFKRLAPDWSAGAEVDDVELRAAPYFKDVPNAAGFLELRDPDQRPLVAYGASPLGGAVTDFRCFYLGTDDNKCKVAEMPFGKGWDDLALARDADFGCRKPFLIVIGDGESHGNTNDPTSAVSNLKKNLVKTWAIDYGGDCDKNSTYFSLTNTGDGECVAPQDEDQLAEALRDIIGRIIEQTKSFSSAAVPTVQADVADRIFLSNFTPLSEDGEPVWIGRMNAFLKPVPLTTDNKPDTSAAALCPAAEPVCTVQADCPANSVCSSTATGRRCLATGCFLWDAGTEMLSQAKADPNDQNGPAADQRRIFYSELTDSGRWPERRHYFEPRVYGVDSPQVRHDFWRALNLSFLPVEVDASTNQATQDTANEIAGDTLAVKVGDVAKPPTPLDPTDDVRFLLGDVFHSNPVVVGSPANTTYFASDVPGYRAFALKHQRRRKVLLVGANDGMLHAFDGGVFNPSTQRFTNGSGKEIFGFIPRLVTPALTELFRGTDDERVWNVDGTPTVADVRIDPAFAPALGPDPAQADWRTVLVAGLRQGGPGYYAIDLTQPDTLDADGVPVPGAGNYVPSCTGADPSAPVTDCGPIPYPAELWEFRDGIYVPALNRVLPLNEDGLGGNDLAESWSTPNIGRIRVVDTGVEKDKFVAVFGGGIGGSADLAYTAGNWLYMVDIETGESIYKFRLEGSAPAEPAAVDTNQDGYLDRIYIGTTLGLMYRVDLREDDGDLPQLEDVEVRATFGGVTYTKTVRRITDGAFEPRIIFKAQPAASTPAVPSRAIFFRPSVLFIAELGQYALAFGTGNRGELFYRDGQTGRFYTFRDDIAVGDHSTFYTEADLQAVDPLGGGFVADFVTDSTSLVKGWYLTLEANERLITNPFALSGIVIFTAFTPDPPPPGATECRRSGTSRIFGVTATNGNGLLVDSTGVRSRFTLIRDFVTDPYTEQAATKNPAQSSTARRNADQVPTELAPVLDDLKRLFPPNCKFGNYRIDIKTLSSDTGVVWIAPVPVCIIEKNWKEFAQ